VREPGPDYLSRHYERPNQPWVCGLASDGAACPAGPTQRGHCPALAECVPGRDGDRWSCNRSALRGGPCAEGPSPEGGCGRVNRCHPLRSLRSTRGRLVASCTLLAVGGLFIVLSADWRDAAISPGPLARVHGQILGDAPSPDPSLTERENCAACHAAAERGAFGWAASLVVGHGGRPDQSQRCMECHDDTIAAEFALAAHNLPPEALRQISASHIADPSWVGRKTHSKEMRSKLQVDSVETRPGWSGYLSGGMPEAIACAACHGEHQGAEFDLTAMNDAACQSCHRQQYESFATNHPEFGPWPYERRTRIAFDHASHQAKHFAEKKQGFDCRSCHMEDATGRVQLTASYEAACASCHDKKIATSVARGVPMFALPTLDAEALRAAGHDIGAWPEAATGDFDGRLPPAMKLLLAADPAAAQAMATLGEDFEFLDVDPDDPAHLAASGVIAAAIGQLMQDLTHHGREAMRERLQASLGRDVSDAEVRLIAGADFEERLQEAQRNWFAEGTSAAGEEAAAVGLGGFEPPYGTTQSAWPRAFDPAGKWRFDAARLEIAYQPSAHADPVLASWVELLAATPNITEQPLALAMFQELAKPTAAGLCISCHSVEQTGERLTINWRAHDRASEPRGLTKFSHGPHVVLPQLSDCTSCHVIDGGRNTASSYEGWNPQAFASEFVPIGKQQCAACHTAKAAGDACQSCHNYHVEAMEEWREGLISDRGLRIAD
jgi:hypothetical protein